MCKDLIRQAVRSTIGTFPKEWTGKAVNYVPVHVAAAERDARLPPLRDLPDFLFDADVDPGMLRTAIHEAGHAAVALAHGMSVSILLGQDEHVSTIGTIQSAEALVEGIPDGDARRGLVSVASAGLVTEILIWGASAYWVGALRDYKALAVGMRRDRMGVIPFAAVSKLEKWGLRIPSPLSAKVTLEELIAARDSLPDHAIDAAIEAWPTSLSIAETIVSAYLQGETVIDAAGVRAAVPAAISSPVGGLVRR